MIYYLICPHRLRSFRRKLGGVLCDKRQYFRGRENFRERNNKSRKDLETGTINVRLQGLFVAKIKINPAVISRFLALVTAKSAVLYNGKLRQR